MQKNEMIQIKELLKRYPKGLSISEISSELQIHRNTAARYLDILKLKGDVDRKQIGTARNYFIVQRVPVSSLIDFWPAPVIIVDSRMHVVMVTKGVLSLLGCSLDVLYGVSIEAIPISLFTNPAIRELCHKGIQGQSESITIRTTIRKRELILRIVAIPVVFDNGRDGAALSFFDETEVRETIQERDLLKQKYSALVGGQKEYIVHVRPDMTISYHNPSFLTRSGRSEKQIQGLSLQSLFPANTHQMLRRLFTDISIRDPVSSGELMVIKTDGTIGREHWEVRGIFTGEGIITTYHAIGRDITEISHCREQLEQYHRNLEAIIHDRTQSMQEANRILMAMIKEKEELEQELLFIKFAFDYASDSILIFSEEGRVIRANQTAAVLLGYLPGELMNLTVYDINPAITKAVWKKMWAAGYPGRRERTTATHRMRDGQLLHVEVSRTFVEFNDRLFFCSIARPIEGRTTMGA